MAQQIGAVGEFAVLSLKTNILYKLREKNIWFL